MKDVNVFNYIDARAYLVECQKKEVPPMAESYRKIGKKIGIDGPYLWLIMHDKKPFSKKVIDTIPGIMALNDKQIKYFKLLMHLGDIKIDKGLLLDILKKFRPAQYHKTAKK